jgi:hypothetical protein
MVQIVLGESGIGCFLRVKPSILAGSKLVFLGSCGVKNKVFWVGNFRKDVGLVFLAREVCQLGSQKVFLREG